MKILLVIFALFYVLFMFTGKVKVNGQTHTGIISKLIGGIFFSGIFALVVGLPILGIVALFTK